MSIVLAFAGGAIAGATAVVIAVGAVLVARGGRGHEAGSGSDPDQVDATWTVDPERLATEIHQLALPAPDPTTPAAAIDDAGAYYPPVDRKPHVCNPEPLGPIPTSMLNALTDVLEVLYAHAGNALAGWLLTHLLQAADDEESGEVADRRQGELESVRAAFAGIHQAHAATTAQFTGQWAAIQPRAADAATVQLAEVTR